jgi:EAL domain-containing protein (putative c-di-GMP-specific phosphodiesterase class I)
VAVDLGQALRNRWLELWYQPKIDLRSMEICGAEALLRARHPTHGIIAPASLLPPPRDPMYGPLTNFVISQALVDWTHFAEHQVLIKSAVNVPVSALQATDFIASIREHLPRNLDFPGMIFEITEDEAIEEPSLLQEIAAQLKIYNISLSIDDFGSGFSSLSRLRDLPFAEIKLDRSFVASCSTDGSKQSLCNAAIELAHGFGASVCAEGVETVDDLRTLIGMRCDTAQGFLFAKPMDSQTFTRSLVARPEKLITQANCAA